MLSPESATSITLGTIVPLDAPLTFIGPKTSKPEWLKVRAPGSENFLRLKGIMKDLRLNTVCEEARCPNLADCFGRGTVTFMLLGDVCTRACRFCHVATGLGRPVDADEPRQVAEAARELGLRHVVLTSVNRDDLADQGSEQFARAIAAVRTAAPRATIEVLTPDFRGDAACIDRVIEAQPDVYNHNLETVPRLYRSVRIGARYERSLALLARVKQRRPEGLSKSGLMLGLGETIEEVLEVCSDLRAVGCDMLTLGQYLQPSPEHLNVERYLPPEEFDEIGVQVKSLGFGMVASGPFVRSSYHAGEMAAAIG
mgnify:CR=1 FL=1